MEDLLTTDSKVGILADDQDKYLTMYKREFENNNLKINATLDIEGIVIEIIKTMPPFFICDLKWDHVQTQYTGITALKEIRKNNKQIFLALLTSYENILSEQDRADLKNDHIKVYPKSDPKVFALNFKRDYVNYIKSQKNEQAYYFNEAKLKTLLHLRAISNHDITVPISGLPDNPSYSIKLRNLIIEVDNETVIGKQFIKEWNLNLDFIRQNIIIKTKRDVAKKNLLY